LPVNNRTAQALLGDQLMKSVQASLQRNAPQLRQVAQNGQSEYRVTLTDYRNSPASFSTSGTVQNYKVVLTVDVKFFDLVKKRVLYDKKGLRVEGLYDLSRGETELQGQTRALKELEETVVPGSLADW
jgi:hypothetical protein